MSLLLDVPFHSQDTPMSCWWACTRMILHYYRGRDYRYPWTLDRVFGGMMNWRYTHETLRPSSFQLNHPIEHYLYYERSSDTIGVPLSTEMCFETAPTQSSSRSSSAFTQRALSCWTTSQQRYDSHTVLDPYFWYEGGMPCHDRAYAIYFQATNCRSVPHRPIPGQWTYDLIEEKVRDYGPLLFIGSSTGGYTHAFVVVGRVNNEIAVYDPFEGYVPYSIEMFNRRVISLGLRTYSPIYLPNSPQILAVMQSS